MSLPIKTETSRAGINVVLAQVPSNEESTDSNLGRALELIDRNRAADLVVFPELFLTGYPTTDAPRASLECDGAEIRELQRRCRRSQTAIVIGFTERADPRPYNTLLMLNSDGSTASFYRKVHLFGHERNYFQEGHTFAAVDMNIASGPVRVGPMICFDIEFPEAARSLADQGAELLISCAANPTRFADEHELAARARSLDNRLPHVYVNHPHSTAESECRGGSLVVAAGGTIIAKAGSGPEELVTTLPRHIAPLAAIDYLKLRRPSTYRYHSTSTE